MKEGLKIKEQIAGYNKNLHLDHKPCDTEDILILQNKDA